MTAKITMSLLLLLAVLTGYSQDSDVSTLLNQKEERWIQKQGFSLNTYNWGNEEINLNLELAAKYRKQSHRFIGYGAAAYAVGSTVGFVSLLTDAFTGNKHPSATTIIGTTVGVTGFVTMIGGGIWKKAKARHRVRDAIRLNNK